MTKLALTTAALLSLLSAGLADAQVASASEIARVAVLTSADNAKAYFGSNDERIALFLRTGAHAAGAQTFEYKIDCNPNSLRSAAENLVQIKPDVVVGHFCKDALIVFLPILKSANIPTIDLNFQNALPAGDSLMRTGFHYNAFEKPIRPDVIASTFIKDHWNGNKFAIISNTSDNSIKNIEMIKADLSKLGLAPTLAEKIDFKPDSVKSIVKNLIQGDVKNIFLSSEPDGIIAFNNAAQEAGFKPVLAGGFEAILYRKRQKLPEGFIGVFEGIANSNKTTPISLALALAPDISPTAAAAGYVSGLAAVRSHSESRSTNDILSTETFETNLGPFYFDREHFRGAERLYHVYKWSNGTFNLSEE